MKEPHIPQLAPHSACGEVALESRRLGAAALQVFGGEPRRGSRFPQHFVVLLQPYQACGTVETRKAVGKPLFDNLAANFVGQYLLSPVLV